MATITPLGAAMYDGASAMGGAGRRPPDPPAELTLDQFRHHLREAVRVAAANAVALLDTRAAGAAAVIGSVIVGWYDPADPPAAADEFAVRFEWTPHELRVTTDDAPRAPEPPEDTPHAD